MEITKGAVCKSLAGNDRNVHYIVIKLEDDFAYISNGKRRKLEKPKKKRLKHLKFTNTVMDISDITDKKLRSMLQEYCDERGIT